MYNSQEYNSQDVATIIREITKQKSFPLSKMLSDIGLGKNVMSHLDNGSMLKADSLAKIADYLEVTTDYLLGRAEQTAQINSNNTNSQIVSGDNNINTNNVINHLPDTEFDINEKKLIEKFRKLDYEEQIGVLADVIGKTKR